MKTHDKPKKGLLGRSIARLRYSLAARLMLLFVVTGAVLAVIATLTLGSALRHQFDRNLRPHLGQYLEYIHQDLGSPPDVDRAKALVATLPVAIQIKGPKVNWSSFGGDLDIRDIDFHRKHRRGGRHYEFGDIDDRVVLKTRSGEHTIYLIMKGRRGQERRFGIPLLLMLLVLYGAYRTIRWLLRPVEDIQQGVELIGRGELDHRVKVRRKDDLGDLTQSINAMASEIEQMLEAKRQLLLAVSHELRSPITRARVSIELLPESEPRSEIDTDLKEMETILTELLETERLNTRHGVLNREAVAPNQIVTELLAEHYSNSAVDVQLSESNPHLFFDAVRFKLLTKNLVDNALRHNGDGSDPVTVQTMFDEKNFVLCVSDHGPGIDSKHLPHLTEPFYRVDPARLRETGGYGLGLYLCRMIAEAHGGTLSITSEKDRGTSVTVTIPVVNPSS